MMNLTKIHLSAKEAELIQNTEWILTKHIVLKKVYQMFGKINEMMKREFAASDNLFKNVHSINGKISKGENYRELPYIILDYPALFNRNNVFAVRTMFWWGNFFSITLHLSGDYKIQFLKSNPEVFLMLKKYNFSVCINSEEWEHHFNEDNYLNAAGLDAAAFQQVSKNSFLKIAKQLPVKEWDNAAVFIMNGFKDILALLQANYQGDKTGLLPGFPKAGFGL